MSDKARVFITITETLFKRFKITGIQLFPHKSIYSITCETNSGSPGWGFNICIFTKLHGWFFFKILYCDTICIPHNSSILNVRSSMVLVYLQSHASITTVHLRIFSWLPKENVPLNCHLQCLPNPRQTLI